MVMRRLLLSIWRQGCSKLSSLPSRSLPGILHHQNNGSDIAFVRSLGVSSGLREVSGIAGSKCVWPFLPHGEVEKPGLCMPALARLASSGAASKASSKGQSTEATDERPSTDGEKPPSQTAAAEGAGGGTPDGKDVNESITELETTVAKNAEALAELKDKLLRTYAEMENLRDRTKREMDSIRKYATQEFAKDLLSVADVLALAQSSISDNAKAEAEAEAAGISSTAGAEGGNSTGKMLLSLLKGVEMTEKDLLRVFKKHGLERFDPIGQPFDPNIHNAQFEVSDTSKEPGTIAVVTKVGYKMHDRVIRPAEVGIVSEPST